MLFKVEIIFKGFERKNMNILVRVVMVVLIILVLCLCFFGLLYVYIFFFYKFVSYFIRGKMSDIIRIDGYFLRFIIFYELMYSIKNIIV